MERKIRVIAFYLPQFHPIPENDQWWGAGFTEWTNTCKARPLFPGHYQPHIPADLGFYDLRLPEAREAQANLARQYGIEGFCYYHYWFAGKRLLQRPLEEVLASGRPDFPFCICWANESWTGVWHGAPNRILIEQTYPGEADHREHFAALLAAFRDARYIRIDGKPLFLIYAPTKIPDLSATLALWRRMAREAGLQGLFLVAVIWSLDWDPCAYGFDAAVLHRLPPRRTWYPWRQPIKKIRRWIERGLGMPVVVSHPAIIDQLLPHRLPKDTVFPCAIPNWDNTPRSKENGLVLHGSSPELFRLHMRKALSLVTNFSPERRVVFIKSWNEWAEGNHLEPDLRFGHGYLQVLKEELERCRFSRFGHGEEKTPQLNPVDLSY